MEDLYSIHPGISRRGEGDAACSEVSGVAGDASSPPPPPPPADLTELMKTQIAGHRRYPSLLSAYIECRKVGATPEVASLLEEVGRPERRGGGAAAAAGEIGLDPELDEFMVAYCRLLSRYKVELSRPLDEAASFLTTIRSQFKKLCGGGATATSPHSDEMVESSEDEPCSGDTGASDAGMQEQSSRLADRELREMLLNKYSGCLSHLRTEFLKKRKKGKLPKDARLALVDWWNTHYRWPYPTEDDKVRLAAMTGLDPRQINNWFVNQRKRHWKPSEDMRFALMEGVTGGGGGSSYDTTLCFGTDSMR
ncbi:unnamed protein product [Triticum turgidum subsp. durum]|uniref:Uncharacterized protein n=1 Tax=Triticum turgidum subsp. durum TaxID=4567 RepID=A0A9R0PXB4_TRITD|nr:unnamed protein product [Triticum turgidum subsp. durum]